MAKQVGGFKNNLTAKVLRFLHRITDTDEIKTANMIKSYTVHQEGDGLTLITVTYVADIEFLEEA